jgi:hypothetical protein
MPSFEEIMAMAQNAQAELQKAQDNLDNVEVEGAAGGGLVSFAEGDIVLHPLKPLGADFARDLAAVAKAATGMPWQVRLTEDGGAPSLQQQEAMAEERVRAEVMGEPAVRALLDAFPDATYLSHQRKEA